MKNISIEYGVGAETVCDWKKNRHQTQDFCAKMICNHSLGNRATLKKAKNKSLDDALSMWFEQECEHGVHGRIEGWIGGMNPPQNINTYKNLHNC